MLSFANYPNAKLYYSSVNTLRNGVCLHNTLCQLQIGSRVHSFIGYIIHFTLLPNSPEALVINVVSDFLFKLHLCIYPKNSGQLS